MACASRASAARLSGAPGKLQPRSLDSNCDESIDLNKQQQSRSASVLTGFLSLLTGRKSCLFCCCCFQSVYQYSSTCFKYTAQHSTETDPCPSSSRAPFFLGVRHSKPADSRPQTSSTAAAAVNFELRNPATPFLVILPTNVHDHDHDQRLVAPQLTLTSTSNARQLTYESTARDLNHPATFSPQRESTTLLLVGRWRRNPRQTSPSKNPRLLLFCA